MSEIVSARRLRKSLLRQIDQNSLNIDRDFGIDINKIKVDNNINAFESAKILENSKKNKKIFTFKNKILIKCFFSLLIVFVSLVCKLCLKDKILSNKYCNEIIVEYKKDYSKENMLEKIEFLSKNNYDIVKYLVPESIINKVKTEYLSIIKPYFLNFDFKNEIIKVINKIDIYDAQSVINNNVNIYTNENKITKEEILDGKGGGDPLIAEASLLEESSAVSMMQDDVSKILSKNINMISPLSGVITSTYGAREQIFENVNSYHTGIDIAAKSGTAIKSATVGKVTKIKKNDKYYGNYVVVVIDGVSLKYAHMSKINVSINEEVTQSTIIGLVGSTGMSTGPHLHFEISIDSRTVDPQNLIKF